MKLNCGPSRRPLRLAAFIIAAPFIILLGYGFFTGAMDAALLNGWVPPLLHPATERYCAPAYALTYVPVIGIVVKFGNCSGYQFVGGPDTTR